MRAKFNSNPFSPDKQVDAVSNLQLKKTTDLDDIRPEKINNFGPSAF